MSLGGKTAIVTGGARGIGRAICDSLSAAGARVAILDLGGAAEAAAELPDAIGVAVDVGDHAAVTSAVEQVVGALGGIDLVVNNAGWDKVEPFLDNDPALWDRLISVNLLGVLNVCHASLPAMIERGGGRIVNVASDAGRVGSSGEVVYGACKGGVIAFTKGLAREVARHGITVNCVCPGPTETPLLEEVKAQGGEKLMDAIVRATPTRRLAEPDEIAQAVAFFAAGPSHVTGQILSVSGGLTMAG